MEKMSCAVDVGSCRDRENRGDVHYDIVTLRYN